LYDGCQYVLQVWKNKERIYQQGHLGKYSLESDLTLSNRSSHQYGNVKDRNCLCHMHWWGVRL